MDWNTPMMIPTMMTFPCARFRGKKGVRVIQKSKLLLVEFDSREVMVVVSSSSWMDKIHGLVRTCVR